MVDSDDLYGPMEVNDDLSTALGTETLADRDVVTPTGFDNTPGFLGRQPTYPLHGRHLVQPWQNLPSRGSHT